MGRRSPHSLLRPFQVVGFAYPLPRPPRREDQMTALAYNSEQIAPKELKPSLLELDGISRESVEAHYKLYTGYVNKRNEILGKLAEVDLSAANQIYSDLRS